VLACGAALAGAAAGPARADDVGVIALAPERAPAAPAEVAQAIERAAAVAGDRAVLDPEARARAQAAAGAVPARVLARFGRVAEVVDEGWRAYLQVTVDYAAARLAAARSDAEGLLALDGGLAIYADASLRLGAVLDHLGRKGAAAGGFRLAAALDPGRPVTTAEFSPDVVAAFAAARAARVASAPVTISAGGAPGATVAIDGGAPGPAPARVSVAVGPHVVVARAPGFAARGQAFAVPAGGAALDVALDPAPAPAAIAVGLGEGPATAAIDHVALYAEVDGVALVAAVWRQGQPALVGQWCDAAPVRCTPVLEVAYADGELGRAADRLWQTLRDARTAARYPPSLPDDPRLVRGGGHGGRRAWWRRPWVLGVGAGVLVAGAATAAVIVSGGERQPVVTVDGSQFIP
jgi:hypothetical protein